LGGQRKGAVGKLDVRVGRHHAWHETTEMKRSTGSPRVPIIKAMVTPSPRVLELLRLAHELSQEERDALISALVDEEEGEGFSPEWRAEIEERLRKDGPGEVLTFDELRERTHPERY
jgi:hypothetical protein